MPRKKTTTDFSFEGALKELEKIVTKMESGELSLEDSLTYFEQGIHLTKQCHTTLKAAQQKVEILSQETNELASFSAKERTSEE